MKKAWCILWWAQALELRLLWRIRFYRGLHNFAGEMGHITLDPQGDLCPCGSRGCVETYMSGPWLARHYHNALTQQKEAYPESQEEISGALVAQLAAQGNELALQVITRAGEALGIAIASMAMILNIDLYVIGGSVAKAGDVFLEPARKIVPKYSFKSVSPRRTHYGNRIRHGRPDSRLRLASPAD